MKYLALLGLISFIAIAIFGFTGLYSHESAFMHCAQSLAGSQSGTCADSAAMGLLHVKIYQSFSLALLAVVAVVLFALRRVLLGKLTGQIRTAVFCEEVFEFTNSYQERIYSWIALHQNSDPLI